MNKENIAAIVDEVVKERDHLLAEVSLHRDKSSGTYWAWQGQGEDHLESLVCPVLIAAADLRSLLTADNCECGHPKSCHRSHPYATNFHGCMARGCSCTETHEYTKNPSQADLSGL